jgi:hypothetical protein
MPFTKSAVELFISARAAAVTRCGASEVRSMVPESEHWLSNFGLAIIFHDFPPTAMRPFVINFIRRVHAAFLNTISLVRRFSNSSKTATVVGLHTLPRSHTSRWLCRSYTSP